MTHMATETDYAWAAGFFDGEGCVSISAQKSRFCLRMIVVQKDPRPVEKFKEIFGSACRIGTVTRRNRKHFYFRLTISGQDAAMALEMMLPYLSLKREVAEVGIKFQARVAASPLGRGAKTPDSEVQSRKELHEQVKWLNSGRWAAATTKRNGPETVCDSLNSSDGKAGEVAEMTTRPN